jgi:hypothetical protein
VDKLALVAQRIERPVAVREATGSIPVERAIKVSPIRGILFVGSLAGTKLVKIPVERANYFFFERTVTATFGFGATKVFWI